MMARTPPASSSTTTKIMPRPNTAIGHAAAARDHAKIAAAHASKSEQLSRDAKRAAPKSSR
jgi:hypothetical protein